MARHCDKHGYYYSEYCLDCRRKPEATASSAFDPFATLGSLTSPMPDLSSTPDTSSSSSDFGGFDGGSSGGGGASGDF